MVAKQRDGDYSSAFLAKWQLLKNLIINEHNIQKISNPRWLCIGWSPTQLTKWRCDNVVVSLWKRYVITFYKRKFVSLWSRCHNVYKKRFYNVATIFVQPHNNVSLTFVQLQYHLTMSEKTYLNYIFWVQITLSER